jgi:hypothetical protein
MVHLIPVLHCWVVVHLSVFTEPFAVPTFGIVWNTNGVHTRNNPMHMAFSTYAE